MTVGSGWRMVRQVPEEVSVADVAWTDSALWVVTGRDGVPSGMVDFDALQAVRANGSCHTPVSAVSLPQPPGWVVDTHPDAPVTDVVTSIATGSLSGRGDSAAQRPRPRCRFCR